MTCPWQLLAADKAQLPGRCMMQVQMTEGIQSNATLAAAPCRQACASVLVWEQLGW